MIKTMNIKMTTNYQPNLKQKQKQTKELEQGQNHRNGNHMDEYQLGGGGREWGNRYRE